MKFNMFFFLLSVLILNSCKSNSDDDMIIPEVQNEEEQIEKNNNPSSVALELVTQECNFVTVKWSESVDDDPDDIISYNVSINNTLIKNTEATTFVFESKDFSFPISVNVTARDDKGGASTPSNFVKINELSELISFSDNILKQALLDNEQVIDKNDDKEITICEAHLFNGKLNLVGKKISDISDLVFFPNAKILDARENDISDVSVLTDLNFESIALGFNNITNFNMGVNESVTGLLINHNKIEELDLSLYPNLENTFLFNNQLSFIDVSNNPNLLGLSAGQNQLTRIDLSKNTKLRTLELGENHIPIIDISNNPELIRVVVSGNPITSIFTEYNPNLLNLLVTNTFVEFIDISKNELLELVWVQENDNLTGINMSNGNNSNLGQFFAINTPSLTCIQVDDIDSIPAHWSIDESITSFSEDCQF